MEGVRLLNNIKALGCFFSLWFLVCIRCEDHPSGVTMHREVCHVSLMLWGPGGHVVGMGQTRALTNYLPHVGVYMNLWTVASLLKADTCFSHKASRRASRDRTTSASMCCVFLVEGWDWNDCHPHQQRISLSLFRSLIRLSSFYLHNGILLICLYIPLFFYRNTLSYL